MSDAADRPGASRPAPEERIARGPLTALRPGSDAAVGAPRAPATTDRRWTRLGHELRTPLHAILGNVELLVDGSAGPLSADARACLGEAQDAARRLMRQIDLVLLLAQAGATPGPGAEDAVDLWERMHAASQRRLARPAVVPEGGRLVLKGDPFWLDAWASALVEAEPDGPGGRVGIERTADPAPHEVGLRIVWSASPSRQPSPVVVMLIDAIVRLHGGRILPQAGAALCLAWPRSRLVAWQGG